MNKFNCICVDIPWSFNDKLKMDDTPRGAAANYSLLSHKEVMALPISDIADPEGAVLALWVPGSLLERGMEVMKKWGFTHKQTYVWVKTKKKSIYFSH